MFDQMRDESNQKQSDEKEKIRLHLIDLYLSVKVRPKNEINEYNQKILS